MIVACFFVAIFGICLKLAAQASDVYWATFLGYVVAFLLLVPLIFKNGLAFYKPKRPFFLFWRIFVGVCATTFYVMALNRISLVNATLLFNTTPLFIPLLALVFLKVRIRFLIWVSLIIGFVGLIFIIRPTDEIAEHFGDWIGLLSGLCLAIGFLMVKVLTRSEPILRMNTYMFGVGSVLLLPTLYFSHHLPSMEALVWSIGSGAAFVLAQYFLIKSYHYAEAYEVGGWQYSSVVFAGFLDWIVWGTVPSLLTFMGMVMVVIGGVLAIMLQSRKKMS